MSATTLLAASVAQVITGASFLVVARRIHGRSVSVGGLLAARAFVAFWAAMGTYMLLEGATGIAAAQGHASFAVDLAVRLASGPLLALAAGGLAFYVLYLFSGNRGWAVPIAAYYGFMGAMYSFSIWTHGPIGVTVGDWSQGLAYERPPAGDPVWSLVLASFGIPLVAGSLAYLALLRRAVDREQRYRITLVATSLLVWVVAGYLGQVAADGLLKFVSLVVVGFVTGLTVLVAYFPPHRVQDWLHHRSHALHH